MLSTNDEKLFRFLMSNPMPRKCGVLRFARSLGMGVTAVFEWPLIEGATDRGWEKE